MAPTTDASTQSVENALRCIFCDSVNTVDACVEERLCAPGQYCYLDKYSVFVRDAEGREKEVIKYNAGCRSSSICHYAQCLHEAILAERNHSIGTREIMGAAHCTQCCTTDRCNLNLCDFRTTGSGALRCYACSNIEDPNTCHDVMYCQPNENCLITKEMRINQDGSLSRVYQQRCERRQLCIAVHEHNRMPTNTPEAQTIIKRTPLPILRSILSHRRSHNLIQIAANCCDADFCNNLAFALTTGTMTTSKETTIIPIQTTAPAMPIQGAVIG